MANWDSNSIVDYLKSQGKDSSYSARKKLAESMGISNYSGSPSQNTQLLNSLKNGSSSNSNNSNSNNNNKSQTTTTTTNNVPKIAGADESLVQQSLNSYTQSNESKEADGKVNDASSRVEELTSKDNIVSQSVYDTLGSTFVKPIEVVQTDAWLGQQLSKIQSGKTSYSDDVRNMISKIQNREKFSYDVDSDQLFQQALASAMGSGKQAMQDTIGQASALTGGYGSTYATSAGNQAYNAFIEDAYDNLPQYYQMAFEKYQAEGQDMYNQLAMLSEEDAKEYERLLTSYNATYQHRNQLYSEAYDIFRDSKTDAYNLGNLQLSEHNQLVSDAYTSYNVAKDNADTIYNRDYTTWADSVAQASKVIDWQNNDYWKQEENADRDESLKYTKSRDKIEDERYLAENDWNGDGKVDTKDQIYYNTYVKESEQSGGDDGKIVTIGDNTVNVDNIPKTVSTKASNFKNNGELEQYLDGQVDRGVITEAEADYLYSTNMIPEQMPLIERNWTLTDDGGTNWFGGIDNNAKVKDQYGNEYTMKDLYKELKKIMSDSEAKNYILNLQKNKGVTK